MRDVDASNITASEAPVVRPVYFVDLDFSGGRVRATDASKSIDFGGNTYTGVGNLGAIGTLTEDQDLSSPGLVVALSGIPADLVAAAIDEEYHQREAIIYTGFLDDVGELVTTPLQIWAGRMDQMRIEIGEGLASIQLTLESRLAMIAPRRAIRNAETQRARFAADTVYDFLDQLGDLKLKWGPLTVAPSRPEADPGPPRALP